MDKNFQRQTHFVGVMIPADIQDRIQEFRSYMNERYGCKSGHGTPSHITLIPPFVLPSEFEDGDVKNAVEKAIQKAVKSGTLPFNARISGFGAFEERTLFAHVESDQKWTVLRDSFVQSFQSNLPGTVRKTSRLFTPHITVANRDIPSGVMDEALQYFSGIELNEEFSVEEICIFVRSPKGGWEEGECVSF
ncbi:MAG: 2'-5' RNA ligase family protein [Treponema sp.]|nr:2'-5' RNA ligase family protein [Treponema sp.]MBP5752068.1 2'-5' RNA ligase family protein [Treponema sp.]